MPLYRVIAYVRLFARKKKMYLDPHRFKYPNSMYQFKMKFKYPLLLPSPRLVCYCRLPRVPPPLPLRRVVR